MKKILKSLSIALCTLALVVGFVGCGPVTPVVNAPVFSGVEDCEVEKGTQFVPLKGVSVTDVEDGDINVALVTVDAKSVNVNVPGEYTVTYTVYDSDGNETKVTRKVTVVFIDRDEPTLYGVANQSILVGDTSFNIMKDVSAIDAHDGDLTSAIVTNGNVDVFTPGEYNVEYKVLDSANNEAKVTRKVTVQHENFVFEEKTLVNLVNGKATISGGEIITTIAPYGLLKLELALNGEANVHINGATGNEKATSVDGKATMFFRFDEPLVNAEIAIDGEVSEVNVIFAKGGDKIAPELSGVKEKIIVPNGASLDYIKQQLLVGVTALDNLEGNLTSSIKVDLKNLNALVNGEYEAELSVEDAALNKTTLKSIVEVAKKHDTKAILSPEFDDPQQSQFKLSSGAGGSVTMSVVDGELVVNIVKAGGWESGDSPYLSGLTTDNLGIGTYVFQFDVKAEIARQMRIRAGLELWQAPWMEDFGPIVKYNITEEYQTLYYVFDITKLTSEDGAKGIKFEIQLGSINWSESENNNVVRFDNCQFYLLSNDNDAPVVSLAEGARTTYVMNSELPDFVSMFEANDKEDGKINITLANIDSSNVDMTKAGTYEVIVTVLDSEGKVGTFKQEIVVLASEDSVGPEITVSPLLMTTLQSFLPVKEGKDLTSLIEVALQSISIEDNVDGNIIPTYQMFNFGTLNVKSANVGTHKITFSCVDSSNNPSNVIELSIPVVDGNAPKLIGVRNVTVYKGTTINPFGGIVAYDTNDGVIELGLENALGLEQFLDASGKVVANAGEYQVTYKATDAAGNETEMNAIFTVVEEVVNFNEQAAIDLLGKEIALGGSSKSKLEYLDGKAVLTYAGAEGWYASAIQLKYYGVELTKGVTYKLVFEAKAELPRELLLYFVDGDTNKLDGFADENAGNKFRMSITDKVYRYEYIFTPTTDSANNCIFELEWDYESYLLNSEVANVIEITKLAILPDATAVVTPAHVDPVVLDDFESYSVSNPVSTNWTKRYSSTNYTDGFEVVEVEGNKVVKFDYKSDNKYLLKYIGQMPTLNSLHKYVKFKAQIANEADKIEFWGYWNGGQNSVTYVVKDILMSDGYYYFNIADLKVSATSFTSFAVAFNYKGGNVAYFDEFTFVEEKAEPVKTFDPIVLDDFESYAEASEVTNNWTRRFNSANHSDGFAVVEDNGNHVVRFEYKSDSKYLFRYLGTLPTLDDAYDYVKLNALFDKAVDKVEFWAYWDGGQNYATYEIAKALKIDGSYYFKISSLGKKASEITSIAIALNYKNGSVAYFDDITFVTTAAKDLPLDIVLDDFESYSESNPISTNWTKRYDSTNYSTGFEVLSIEEEHVAKFDFNSSKKYLFKYIGQMPTLTEEHKYVKLNMQLEEAVDQIEFWGYWNGGQNSKTYKVEDIKRADGMYYLTISDLGKKATDLTSIAIAFNFKNGTVAYFDNITFTYKMAEKIEKPQVQPLLFDDFESYADDAALGEVWVKRYSGTNYTTGYSLVEQDGNKAIKFDYKSDNKYIFVLKDSMTDALSSEYQYFKFDAIIPEAVSKLEFWGYWNGGQNGTSYEVSKMIKDGNTYYVPISVFSTTADKLVRFGIALNYQNGSTIYFDNFGFVASVPTK